MDTGNKTLAQLSEEGKGGRYVTLDVAAKISGYTKDYLERLCRLRKVNFLERHIGDHVIELESLLKETHTILLSYEGLTFVDSSDLHAPPETMPQYNSGIAEEGITNAVSTPRSAQIPNFAQNRKDDSRANEDLFSFTGRAVVSDARQPEKKIIPSEPPPLVSTHTIANVASLPAKKVEVASPAHMSRTILHIPIEGDKPAVVRRGASGVVVTSATILPVARSQKNEIGTIPPPATTTDISSPDEWDARLLGMQESSVERDAPHETPHQNLSPYHPIATSRNAHDHHEDLPLFPPLMPKEKIALLPSGGENSDQIAEAVKLSNSKASQELANTPLSSTEEAKDTARAQVFPDTVKAISKQIPLTASGAPLFGATNQKASLQAASPSSLPAMRVMPQLPMTSEEHHLERVFPHQLAAGVAASLPTKSLGFNIAFAAFLALSSFLVLSASNVGESNKFSGFLSKQIAAVGEALGGTVQSPKKTEFLPLEKQSGDELEFSDEVIITPGDTSNTVLVQPVFKEQAGSVVEYTIDTASGG